jgi:hypothetical protein
VSVFIISLFVIIKYENLLSSVKIYEFIVVLYMFF